MSIEHLWNDRTRPTISFELFPARDEKAAKKLAKAIDTLADLGPDFASVTFGAGGATREGSLELAQYLKVTKGLKVAPYLAGYGLAPAAVADVAESYRQMGADGLFCVRGDVPENLPDFVPHPAAFTYASDLLTFVNIRFDFFTGAAGYPEGHKEAITKETDLEYLKLKVVQGAKFIITQYVYDNAYFFDFRDRARAMGIHVPIICGVMPIYSVKMTENLAAMCGATITPQVRDGLAALPPDDKKAVTDFGVDFATEQCRELIQNGVDGIHFYTMDRGKSVAAVITKLKEEKLL